MFAEPGTTASGEFDAPNGVSYELFETLGLGMNYKRATTTL